MSSNPQSDPLGRRALKRRAMHWALFCSGLSGLSWELLWQHHASLAIGVSSYGTAITLAAMMAGMGLGGLAAARWAQRGRLQHPIRAFGVCELVIGISALAVSPAFAFLARIDAAIYATAPGSVAFLQFLGSMLILLIPSTAMGATLPILAPLATRVGSHIARFYSLNLVGAVSGVLLATFLALPTLGVARTSLVAALVNLGVALWALSRRDEEVDRPSSIPSSPPPARHLLLAFASGFVVFALEVAWFRSLRAALQATTESFALILASFLVALSLGSWLASHLRERRRIGLSTLIFVAAILLGLTTPAVDVFDLLLTRIGVFEHFTAALWIGRSLEKLFWLLLLLGLPVTLLGMVFPWLLADHDTTGGSGRLYAANTLGAVSGALLAGFVLLPWLGATRTGWLVALFLLWASLLRQTSLRRAAAAGAITLAFLLSLGPLGAGSVERRVKGRGMEPYEEILFVDEGPDSTVWVAQRSDDGSLGLIIDGFAASAEVPEANYMQWMGHLPALASTHLDEALVICFGTGQTVHAVRQHGPRLLHVVDINESVFRAADLFSSNHHVLDDSSVIPVVMDGRAYLRRRQGLYDLVTLEPMPPNFAGSNNLYSSEFYELIATRLAEDGVVAQWVPFHLLALRDMVAILGSFLDVFPESRLWIDPASGTGVIVGGRLPWRLHDSPFALPLPLAEVDEHFLLGPEALAALVADQDRVTDDNQLLAFGYGRLQHADDATMSQANLTLLHWYAQELESPAPGSERTPPQAGTTPAEAVEEPSPRD